MIWDILEDVLPWTIYIAIDKSKLGIPINAQGIWAYYTTWTKIEWLVHGKHMLIK